MALGKHNVRVKALAGLIARALGNALVAPVLAYVPEGGLRAAHRAHAVSGNHHPSRRRRSSGCWSPRRAASASTAFGTSCCSATAGRTSRDSGRWRRGSIANGRGRPSRVHAIDEYYRASTDGFREILRSKGYRDEEIGHPRGSGRHVADAGHRSDAWCAPIACAARRDRRRGTAWRVIRGAPPRSWAGWAWRRSSRERPRPSSGRSPTADGVRPPPLAL